MKIKICNFMQFLLLLWCGSFFLYLYGIENTLFDIYISIILKSKYLIFIMYLIVSVTLTDKEDTVSTIKFNIYIVPMIMFLIIFPSSIMIYVGSFNADLSISQLNLVYKSIVIGSISAILSFIYSKHVKIRSTEK